MFKHGDPQWLLKRPSTANLDEDGATDKKLTKLAFANQKVEGPHNFLSACTNDVAKSPAREEIPARAAFTAFSHSR